jgi:hypothetical protein
MLGRGHGVVVIQWKLMFAACYPETKIRRKAALMRLTNLARAMLPRCILISFVSCSIAISSISGSRCLVMVPGCESSSADASVQGGLFRGSLSACASASKAGSAAPLLSRSWFNDQATWNRLSRGAGTGRRSHPLCIVSLHFGPYRGWLTVNARRKQRLQLT